MTTRIFLRFVIAVAVVFIGKVNTMAQSTATAGVAASVIVPITIVKNVDMNFGNASVSAVSGGSIVLAPAGTRTTAGPGVTLPAATGTVAAAAFTITGAPGFTYAITLPGSVVINGPGASSMSVSGFTSTPSGTGNISSGGTQYLTVGATLNIAPSQVPGAYTNATAIPVVVNYN